AIGEAECMPSGTAIGNDGLGTAMNTILFGTFGSFLSLFLWYFRLHYTIGEVLDEKLFVNEAVLIRYSLIGAILTVPLSSCMLSRGMSKKGPKHESRKSDAG